MRRPVETILRGQSAQLHALGPQASVAEAVRLMNHHNIGAVLVVDGDQQLLGIFTERDVLRRVVAERQDPEATRIGEVMTRDCVVGTPGMPINEVQQLMKHRRIRHLPILNEREQLVGMVSIGDVNALLSEDHEIQLQYLDEYFTRSA